VRRFVPDGTGHQRRRWHDDWSELERRVYVDCNALTWHELETYTARVWPLLLRLTADERERLRRGLLDGTLRNIEETRGKHSASDPVKYLAVLIALLSFFRGNPDPVPQPPVVTVIIEEIPPEIRPTEPYPPP